MTCEELIQFENEIAGLFNAGKIRAPVHLYSNNEAQMIDLFREVRPEDWVCCSWRSHYQCLLKGVPPERVREEILAGRSISLCFPEYRVVSSAIVGGIVPIAVGIALGLKRGSKPGRVHCFMGEMTAESGIAYESMKVRSESPTAYTIHRRGQWKIGLHGHPGNLGSACPDARGIAGPDGGLLQVPNEISACRCRR